MVNDERKGGESLPFLTKMSSYPIVMDKGPMLDQWLNQLLSFGDDDRRKDHEHCRCCHYVHRRHQHLHPADLPSYYEILELPCGCRDRRGCLEQRLRKANFNGTCPVCLRFKLFKKWTLDGWFELRVETVDINYLLKKKWDPDCSICLRPYAKAIDPKKSRKASSSSFIIREKPIQLPCKHILGYRCMKKWLGPKSEGGSQNNTCPMCRKAFFTAWTNPEEDDFEDDEEFEEEGDYEEGGHEEENPGGEEAQAENADESPVWESFFDNQDAYVDYQYIESDSEDSDDADGPVELLSTGWHRFVASKATWKPCDTPENSDSEPRTEDEDEEEEEEDDDDDEDEDKEEEDEEHKDEDEEPAENDEEAEEDAELVAEEPMHEETMERTEPTVETRTGSTADPEPDLEEIEPDAELQSRAERLQQTRKRERVVEEDDHDEDERQEPETQRRRLH